MLRQLVRAGARRTLVLAAGVVVLLGGVTVPAYAGGAGGGFTPPARISLAGAISPGSAAVAGGVRPASEPASSAYDFMLYDHATGSWAWTGYNVCSWSGVPRANYSVSWEPYGDKVFVRDCKAEGWGVRAAVYTAEWNYDGGYNTGTYTGLTIHDCCSVGDGGWKGMSSIQERSMVYVRVWSYKGSSMMNMFLVGPFETTKGYEPI